MAFSTPSHQEEYLLLETCNSSAFARDTLTRLEAPPPLPRNRIKRRTHVVQTQQPAQLREGPGLRYSAPIRRLAFDFKLLLCRSQLLQHVFAPQFADSIALVYASRFSPQLRSRSLAHPNSPRTQLFRPSRPRLSLPLLSYLPRRRRRHCCTLSRLDTFIFSALYRRQGRRHARLASGRTYRVLLQ